MKDRWRAAPKLPLPPAGAYHVARVLRMREGAPLSVFDGSGQEFRAEIVRVDGDEVTVRLGEPTPGTAESPLRITLLQGVSRSERMDWTLQKATELGVAADRAGADRAQRRAPRREAGAEEAGSLARHRDRRLRAMRPRARFRTSRRR